MFPSICQKSSPIPPRFGVPDVPDVPGHATVAPVRKGEFAEYTSWGGLLGSWDFQATPNCPSRGEIPKILKLAWGKAFVEVVAMRRLACV